jgi:hypothetical protein
MDSMVNYIYEKYDVISNYKDSVMVILVNTDLNRRLLLRQSVDKAILPGMNQLKIDQIIIEHGKFNCDSNVVFERIEFRFHKKESFPIVYFVYDFCNRETARFESDELTHEPLAQNWYLSIDNTD